MKVRIEMSLDIDAEAWREEMMADPDVSVREVREDVKSWVKSELTISLSDRGLLAVLADQPMGGGE